MSNITNYGTTTAINRMNNVNNALNTARSVVNGGCGVIIPMYVYPSDGIYDDARYNLVIDLAKIYTTVDIHVIINPNNGPGEDVNLDYLRAIRRLQGAGCYVYGYVATGYSDTATETVLSDIDTWLNLYGKLDGIFFDEMSNADTIEDRAKYKNYTNYAHYKGIRLTMGNPGTIVPVSYFSEEVMDFICTHETDSYPAIDKYTGDWADSYMEYNKAQRVGLVYGQDVLDVNSVKLLAKYHSLIYVTNDVLDNPWDDLSSHYTSLVSIINSIANGYISFNTYVDESDNRALDTDYVNNEGKDITITYTCIPNEDPSGSINVIINGVDIGTNSVSKSDGAYIYGQALIPAGATYRLSSVRADLSVWIEYK
jgi:hypothetical protein